MTDPTLPQAHPLRASILWGANGSCLVGILKPSTVTITETNDDTETDGDPFPQGYPFVPVTTTYQVCGTFLPTSGYQFVHAADPAAIRGMLDHRDGHDLAAALTATLDALR